LLHLLFLKSRLKSRRLLMIQAGCSQRPCW
jgi:hypothetical protein